MKLATVIKIYDRLNAHNFGGVMNRPVILFSRTKTLDGFYDGMTMQFNLADTKGYVAVTELIYHEMVHQYVQEFLELDQVNHGNRFKQEYRKFSFGVTTDVNYA